MKEPIITKHLEIKTYIHKDVSVAVKIDYDKKEISLMEGGNLANHKQWIFSKRGLEFMQGWQNILDAMKFAIKEATKELKAHVDAQSFDNF